jgi:hypothetical protein
MRTLTLEFDEQVTTYEDAKIEDAEGNAVWSGAFKRHQFTGVDNSFTATVITPATNGGDPIEGLRQQVIAKLS